MISVIIPTYKEPEYLDLCLESCIEGQVNDNEIIVVVDGHYDVNKEVLKKWSKNINILDLEENKGLPRGINIGVYNASNEKILVVNDDNVFMNEWDYYLERLPMNNVVYSVNQIEPNPSIFPQFVIHNYGKSVDEFNLDNFWNTQHKHIKAKLTTEGGTSPFFMLKNNYMAVGGWDENYPTNGVVADWDFFCKCELAGFGLARDYNTVFYHFAQVATGNQRQETEQAGHSYFYYKWGTSYIPKALRIK